MQNMKDTGQVTRSKKSAPENALVAGALLRKGPLSETVNEAAFERFLRAQRISAMLANTKNGLRERMQSLAEELASMFEGSRVTVSILNGSDIEAKATSGIFEASAEHCFYKDIVVEGKELGKIVIESKKPIDPTSDALLESIVTQAGWCVVNFEEIAHRSEQALTDHLTGLGNRRALFELAGWLFPELDRKEERLHFIYIDVDHFKDINDRHGHETGNTVLRFIALVMKGISRADSFRHSGDEFILLARGKKEAFERYVRIKGGAEEMGFSVSVGIAERMPGESLLALIKRADDDMYAEKRKKQGGGESTNPLGASVVPRRLEHQPQQVAFITKPGEEMLVLGEVKKEGSA